MNKFIILLALLLLFSNLLKAQNRNDSILFAEIESGRNDRFEWKKEWNIFIADAIDLYGSILMNNDSLPLEQISTLCPGFATANNNQKKAFWVLVIASIAKFESNFNPNTRFFEPPPLNVFSEGLLQLSYGDEKNFKGSEISKSENNILNPKVNLETGVIILSKQLKVKKVLFTSSHYYWSVLTNKKKEIKNFFLSHSGNLNFCQ